MQEKTGKNEQRLSGNAVDSSPQDMAKLTAELKAEAQQLGFLLAGVCPAISATGVVRLHEWIDLGYAGEMHYLKKRESAYAHPEHVLNGARSLLMLALPYGTEAPPPLQPGQARVSRYAWGTVDYHDVIHDRLKRLGERLIQLVPSASVRGVVDSAPLLEREFAQRAGLGWIGKHTLLLNRQSGSYFFLAALLTDVELSYDQPHATDHCGTCTACLDACPTQAFPQPYVLDATRCISYLTIELREHVPLELRSGVGDWLFGCDVCQDVCPWNRKAPLSGEEHFHPQDQPADAIELLSLDDEAFRRRFRHTPLWRSKRRGILRNAAIVLGNQRRSEAISALTRALHDSEPLVRGACAWALGRIATEDAKQALADRQRSECDADVLSEIESAVTSIEGNVLARATKPLRRTHPEHDARPDPGSNPGGPRHTTS
jgi:epoxyqueuosine reductase